MAVFLNDEPALHLSVKTPVARPRAYLHSSFSSLIDGMNHSPAVTLPA